MDSMSNKDTPDLAAFLKAHPRLLGVLFTTCLFLAQALPVLAGSEGGGGTGGP